MSGEGSSQGGANCESPNPPTTTNGRDDTQASPANLDCESPQPTANGRDDSHTSHPGGGDGRSPTRVHGEEEEGRSLLEDSVDALPVDKRYSWLDLLCTLVSVATYVFDLAMDIIVAVYFYHLAVSHGIYHYWYFGLTLAFIVVPSITMTGFSFRWYLMDADNGKMPEAPLWRWSVRLAALILQVAPILRYVDSIAYGVLSRWADFKARRAKTQEIREREKARSFKYYTLMVYEDADATLLRLFECFMESAPQLVLQIYILIRDPHAVRLNEADIVGDTTVDPILKVSILVMSIVSSLISLAWSLVVYHRSLRYTYPDKKNISAGGSLCQFLWHFSSITARVLALSLFASAYPKQIGVVIAVHWAIMTAWVIFQKTKACNSRCEELFFSVVLGAIYIFSFFNAKEEPTRYKYLFYYSFCFVENTVLVVYWFTSAVRESSWYTYPGIVAHYLMFFGGLLFMFAYYGCFHPTGRKVTLVRIRRMFAKSEKSVQSTNNPEEEGEGIPLDVREVTFELAGGDSQEATPGGNDQQQQVQVRYLSKTNLSKSTPAIEDQDEADGGDEARRHTLQAERSAGGAHAAIRKTYSAPTAGAMDLRLSSRRTLKTMVKGDK